MLLSNSKIDYSSVRRMPTVKLSGQTQGTTATTTNTMPTSTSLQDISSHHPQKFTWNDDNDEQQLIDLSEKIISTDTGRQISLSHSDDRIFEHPEVTIKPSALDDEIQRRLLSMRSSNTSESLTERDAGTSVPNTLEHPDMRSPVVMQTQQMSLSSSTLLINNDPKRVVRTQSADIYPTIARTPSPQHHVEFFIDNNQNSIRSTSPESSADDRTANSKSEDLHSSSSTTKDSTQLIQEYSTSSSKSNTNKLQTKKNDSW